MADAIPSDSVHNADAEPLVPVDPAHMTTVAWEDSPSPVAAWKRFLARAKPESLFLSAIAIYVFAALAGWLAGIAPNIPTTMWINGVQQDGSIYGGSVVQHFLVSSFGMLRYYAIAQIAWSIGRVISDAVRESGRDKSGAAKNKK